MSKLNHLKTGGIFLIPIVLTFAVFYSLSNGSEYYYKMKVINTSYGNHHQSMMFPTIGFTPTVSSTSTVETKEWDKDNDNIPDYIDIDMGGDIGKSSVYGPINDLSNHPSNLYFPKQSDRFSDADITQNKMLNSRMRASDPFDITGYQTKSVFKAI